MALTEKTETSYEVSCCGDVSVKTVTIILKDGEEISRTKPHRAVAMAGEEARLDELLGAEFPDEVAAIKAHTFKRPEALAMKAKRGAGGS